MLFDGPTELPIATLRPPTSRGHRAMRVAAAFGALDLWLSHRWAWLRPRTVPLLVAFAGFIATLAAVKYVSVWSYREPLQLVVHSRVSDHPPAGASSERVDGRQGGKRAAEPVRILIRPIAPTDRYLELTIGADDPR